MEGVAELFDTSIQKLILQYNMCLTSSGDCSEVAAVCTHFLYTIKIFYLIDCFVNSSLEITFRLALV
jgi:hypothetical protein